MKRALFFTVMLWTVLSACNAGNIATLSPDKVAKDFYNWYLHKVYLKDGVTDPSKPKVIFGKDGHYEIDTASYNQNIRKTAFFSEDFIKKQNKLFETCNKAIYHVSKSDIDKCDCFVTDLVDGDQCACLGNMVWTGGQGEELDSASIKSSAVNGDKADVVVNIHYSASTGSNKVYSVASLTLTREQNLWKISDIVIAYP